MKTDIILAGVGGQGILSIATILGAAALSDNLYLKQAEVHGMSQRGGDVMSCLRLSSSPIASDLIPQGAADIVISLEPMETLRYLKWLAADGWIVTNTVPFKNIDNYPADDAIARELAARPRIIQLDAEAIAKEAASPRSANMALLGAAAPFLELPVEKLEQGIRDIFARKGEQVVEQNLAAFRAGYAHAQKQIG